MDLCHSGVAPAGKIIAMADTSNASDVRETSGSVVVGAKGSKTVFICLFFTVRLLLLLVVLVVTWNFGEFQSTIYNYPVGKLRL